MKKENTNWYISEISKKEFSDSIFLSSKQRTTQKTNRKIIIIHSIGNYRIYLPIVSKGMIRMLRQKSGYEKELLENILFEDMKIYVKDPEKFESITKKIMALNSKINKKEQEIQDKLNKNWLQRPSKKFIVDNKLHEKSLIDNTAYAIEIESDRIKRINISGEDITKILSGFTNKTKNRIKELKKRK